MQTLANILTSPAACALNTVDREILAAHVLQKSRSWVIAHEDYTLSDVEQQSLISAFSRRADHVPVAYITNHKSFYDLDFYVDENVLVPRPESEMIVDHVTTDIQQNKDKNHAVIDVGTGSGCLILSVTHTLHHLSNITYSAVDISDGALQVAQKNKKILLPQTHIAFYKSDLLRDTNLSDYIKKILSKTGQLTLIANLPYVDETWEADLLKQQDSIALKHEPHIALYAPKQGLFFYQQLLSQLVALCRDSHADHVIKLYLEINDHQKDSLTQIIKDHFPHASVEAHKDLANHHRLIIAKL